MFKLLVLATILAVVAAKPGLPVVYSAPVAYSAPVGYAAPATAYGAPLVKAAHYSAPVVKAAPYAVPYHAPVVNTAYAAPIVKTAYATPYSTSYGVPYAYSPQYAHGHYPYSYHY